MFGIFKRCNHPFKYLVVNKDSTVKSHDTHPSDFNIVTHHLQCQKCGKYLDITYNQLICGVKGFLKRKNYNQEIKMKLTPTSKEDFKEVETIQGIRERIQRYTKYDPLTAQVLKISRENDLTSQEAMVLLAYNALMRIEALDETMVRVDSTSQNASNQLIR